MMSDHETELFGRVKDAIRSGSRVDVRKLFEGAGEDDQAMMYSQLIALSLTMPLLHNMVQWVGPHWREDGVQEEELPTLFRHMMHTVGSQLAELWGEEENAPPAVQSMVERAVKIADIVETNWPGGEE